jgi:hypothetical protein
MIHICKDGTISYRQHGEPVFNGVALPVFSVDTVEEAQALQILCCARQYVEHPQLPGKPWYRLSSPLFPPSLELEHLAQIAALLRQRYTLIKARQQVPA